MALLIPSVPRIQAFLARHADNGEEINSTMTTPNHDHAQREAALALWRYAHDYLRAAQALCRQHRIGCVDSQVPYHLVAQGIEFALKAYLRAKGVSMTALRAALGHSLSRALEQSEARGMPRLPVGYRSAIEKLSICHRDTQFVHLETAEDAFPDIDPLVDAGVWILDWIAPDVVEHYVIHVADASSPPPADFVHRLRTDLRATSEAVPWQASVVR